MIRTNIILVLLFFLYSCTSGVEEKITYYDNGNIKFSVPIKNKVGHGPYVFYYENGMVRTKGTYVNGLKQGISSSYYPSGELWQEALCKDDKVVFRKYFRKDGTLENESYYEDNKLVDFLSYKKEGIRDFDRGTTRPIIYAESDTVLLGEYYRADIRLGNRKFSRTGVVINGDTSTSTVRKPRLPMLDSLTSVYQVKTSKLGINYFKGIILDFGYDSLRDETEYLFTPFGHQYFVKDSL